MMTVNISELSGELIKFGLDVSKIIEEDISAYGLDKAIEVMKFRINEIVTQEHLDKQKSTTMFKKMREYLEELSHLEVVMVRDAKHRTLPALIINIESGSKYDMNMYKIAGLIDGFDE